MLRDFRKPLVIAAPKIGLKHPKAVSQLDQFAAGTKF
jgi:2-oxoglutarate dehydrogenase complex dehydrogenase (E1) component-like enzyme